uniref:Very-long-chain (3R)-3-hydroxyacyl-CoA dehydratase n=1 Tax=Auxenochlorella protothecoides TaxID=3075 RepID=A0A1D1ZYW9_AUXPR
MSGRSAYLLAYNATLSAGWAYVLYLTLSTIANGGSLMDVWQAVELPLEIVQTAAIAEVIHAALGVVRSPVLVTSMQVASRLWILWGIVHLVPEAVTARQVAAVSIPGTGGAAIGLSLATLTSVWALSEVLRYGHFAAKEAGIQSKALLWLRYTGFIVLYPLGVSSELAMVYLASGPIRKQRLLSLSLPNRLNVAFDYYVVCWIIVLAYVPAFPQLYGYMLAQRRKLLGGARRSKLGRKQA